MRGASVAICIAALIIASSLVGAGTYAYYAGDKFIIDFSSPETIEPVISGLSPGETVYIVMEVPNPHYARITAQIRILNVICDENGVVEPELEWYELHGERNDIDAATAFGLWIDRDGDTGGCDTAAGDEWIIDEAEGIHIDEIAGSPIHLGTIEPGEKITVVTSYHMDEETENWAQSDKMTFDIEVTREEVPSVKRAVFTPPPPPPPNAVVEDIPAGQAGYVVDASELAGVTVTLDTVAPVTVTILRYDENPHPDDPMPAEALPRYVDVMVSDPDAVVWPIYVKISYTDEEVEGLDEESLGIYYWRSKSWHRCGDTGVDTDRNIVWAYMTRFEASGSPILIGGTSLPKPAEFVVSELMFLKPEVEVGEENTVSVVVRNVGEQPGSYTVTLRLECGPIVIVEEKEVALEGGESKMIDFTFTLDVEGTCRVEADGLEISFEVIAPLPPRPAEFRISDLRVSPEEVEEGGAVTVTVTIANVGEEPGAHTVRLEVDGRTMEKVVTLDGGTSEEVSFTFTMDVEGIYDITVDGLAGSITVSAPPALGPAWMRPGYVAGILIIIVSSFAAAYSILRRRSMT